MKKYPIYIYATIAQIKDLPYDLKSGKEEEEIIKAVVAIIQEIPTAHRIRVFQLLDGKARSFDLSEYGVWHPYIRQIRNRGLISFK
jgi:hypothetical protein